MNVPPQLIAEADQAFAKVNNDLDNLVDGLRKGMSDHPEYNNSASLLWLRSALDYREKLEGVPDVCDRELHCHTANLMIAAIFRLVRES